MTFGNPIGNPFGGRRRIVLHRLDESPCSELQNQTGGTGWTKRMGLRIRYSGGSHVVRSSEFAPL